MDLSVAINNLIEEYSFMSIDYSTRGIVIDAGGFIGTSAIMLSQIYPNLKIISIEPSKLNFNLLLLNVSKYKNIIPMHRALVGNNSTKSIYLHGRKTGNWGFTTISNSKLENRHKHEKTETVTVNKLLKRHRADRIKFFKVDIEGGEVDLLESSKSWIRKTDIIFIELHDRIHHSCSVIFNEKSFGRLNLKIAGEKYLSIFSR
jgi:FkbM family methyltransferase